MSSVVLQVEDDRETGRDLGKFVRVDQSGLRFVQNLDDATINPDLRGWILGAYTLREVPVKVSVADGR